MEKQEQSLPVFNPEQINEQIAYLAGIQDPQVQDATPGARTISELRRVSAENEAILDRVRVRLARHEAAGEARKEEHVIIDLFQSSRMRDDTMQEKTNPKGMGFPRNISQTSRRNFPRRALVNGFVAAVAILVVGIFAIFTALPRSGMPSTTVGASHPVQQPVQQPAQLKAISHGESVCSVANEDNILFNGYQPPTLAWSSQGEVASAFTNLKTFSAKDCTVLSSQEKQIFYDTTRWSPDGQKLVAQDSGLVLVQDRQGNAIAKFTNLSLGVESINAASWTPDSKKILIITFDANNTQMSVRSLEAVSGGKMTTLLTFDIAHAPAGRSPMPMSISPDGKLVAVQLIKVVGSQTGATGNTNGVEIWSLASGKKVSTISLKQSGFLSSRLFAWSPDSSRLALVTGSRGDTVRIYATTSGASLSSFKDNNATSELGIGALVWSPNGNFLAESAAAIRIWDVKAQKIVATFGQADARHFIAALAWSPDGRGLVSATISMPVSTDNNSQDITNIWKLS